MFCPRSEGNSQENWSKNTISARPKWPGDFGVTDAAISQYLKAKRGTSKEIENSGKYEEFRKEVEVAAVRIVNGSDIVTETCRICEMVKKSGMLGQGLRDPHRSEGPRLRLSRTQDAAHLNRLVRWNE